MDDREEQCKHHGNKIVDFTREFFMETGVVIEELSLKLLDRKRLDYEVYVKVDGRKDGEIP